MAINKLITKSNTFENIWFLIKKFPKDENIGWLCSIDGWLSNIIFVIRKNTAKIKKAIYTLGLLVFNFFTSIFLKNILI